MATGTMFGMMAWLGMGLHSCALVVQDKGLADTDLMQVSVEQELQVLKLQATKGLVVFNQTTHPAIPAWLRYVHSFSGSCLVHGSCIMGTHSPGTCTIGVDTTKAEPVWSTSLSTTGEDALVFNGRSYQSNGSGLPSKTKPTSDITWTSQSDTSVFTLCWHRNSNSVASKAGSLYGRPGRARGYRVENTLAAKCMWVNGLCWLWAAPCAGSCASVQLGDQHPGVLRYANETEWSAANTILNESRAAFHEKCAASLLVSPHDHCDGTDLFSRHGPNSEPSSDELVLIYDLSVVVSGHASATGDPHLVNQLGQRFDLYRTGLHTLLQIPRWSGRRRTLLLVQAHATQAGGACADVYFTALNISGHWVERSVLQERAVLPVIQYLATSPPVNHKRSESRRFGKVGIKVVWGHTVAGTRYLNLIVKHLDKIGFQIGGLLGVDDHTLAETPRQKCKRTLSLLQGAVFSTSFGKDAAASIVDTSLP